MEGAQELIKPYQEALEEYKTTYMGARNLAARSRVEYENDVLQFLLFLQDLGVRDLKLVAPKHIHSYLAELDDDCLAGVTRRKKLTIVRTFFGWLQDHGYIAASPARAVVPPQREEREPRVLSKEEYQRLLSVVQKPRDRAIIQLLLQTGIRLSEIQRLTLSDLNLPKRISLDARGILHIFGEDSMREHVFIPHAQNRHIAS
jgi:integrase/recombinase XerD